MTAERLPKIERRALRLASDALTASMAGDWGRATTAVKRISDECGGVGMGRALLGWSDTLIARMPARNGRPFQLSFMETTTGRVDTNADDVPPHVRWAGRVIAARAKKDQETWDALMEALPDDGLIIAEHVSALLQMVTLTLRRANATNGGGSR